MLNLSVMAKVTFSGYQVDKYRLIHDDHEAIEFDSFEELGYSKHYLCLDLGDEEAIIVAGSVNNEPLRCYARNYLYGYDTDESELHFEFKTEKAIHMFVKMPDEDEARMLSLRYLPGDITRFGIPASRYDLPLSKIETFNAETGEKVVLCDVFGSKIGTDFTPSGIDYILRFIVPNYDVLFNIDYGPEHGPWLSDIHIDISGIEGHLFTSKTKSQDLKNFLQIRRTNLLFDTYEFQGDATFRLPVVAQARIQVVLDQPGDLVLLDNHGRVYAPAYIGKHKFKDKRLCSYYFSDLVLEKDLEFRFEFASN